MSQAVFISYARSSSKQNALALQQALGAETCFLDTADIGLGSRFPSELTNALLAARVVVVFIDHVYFERWYCWREWMLAREPYTTLLSRGGSNSDLTAALEHVVIALPEHPDAALLARIPPQLQVTNFPQAGSPALVEMVQGKLAALSDCLRDRLDRAAVSQARRRVLIDEAALPLPGNTAGMLVRPRPLLPSIGPHFVGRTNDLWHLHVLLSEPRLGSPGRAGVTGAIQGGGGFGKSRLAIEYLHRFGPMAYPGGLFWIDASEASMSLAAQHHAVLAELERETPSLSEFMAQHRDARAEMEGALHKIAAKAPILFVVDNIPETAADTIPAPLSTWCPNIGQVTCLATSRVRLDLAGIEPLNLHVLDEESAVAMLTGRGEWESSLAFGEWAEVADWVGRLPMALELLHASLRLSVITPHTVLQSARGNSTTVLYLDSQAMALRGQVPDGALRGITEAFQLSYDCLDAPSRELARRLAWIAPAFVPDYLLEALSPGAEGAAARAAIVARSFLGPTDVIGSDRPSVGRRMHRVLADFLRSKGLQADSDIPAVVAAISRALSRVDGDVSDSALKALMVAPAAARVFQLLEGLHLEPKLFHDGILQPLLSIAQNLIACDERAGDSTLLLTAIVMLRFAKSRLDSNEHFAQWAVTQSFLATALLALGDRDDGTVRLEEAVSTSRSVLQVVTRERAQMLWAGAQVDLANALEALGKREVGTGRLQEAVDACCAALTVFDREREPLPWAKAHCSLAHALAELGSREEGTERLTEAVKAYRAVLGIYTRVLGPKDCAVIQSNMGNALKALGEREKGTQRLEEAIAAYRAALEFCKREDAPLLWAANQDNLGTALRALGKREKGTQRLEEAITACHASLEVCTRARAPLQWAMTQSNLGNSLTALGKREERPERLEQAVTAYRAALEVCTREGAAQQWAGIQGNLGSALQVLGERETGTRHLEEAITAYRAALEVYKREDGPLYWAGTQNNLGNALQALGHREGRTQRFEEAVTAYSAAMEGGTRARAPQLWGMLQNGLGTALLTLGEHGEGTQRLQEAVTAYRAALEVCSREGAAQQWAGIQGNLGRALQVMGARERGTQRLKEAAIAYRAALEVCTREGAPQQWAMLQDNLGWTLHTLGDREGRT